MIKFLLFGGAGAAALYLFSVCPHLSGRSRMKTWEHTMFAHRGYHSLQNGIPENSIPAFREALQHGYGIELDLHLTRDGRLVVFHDDTLKRVCNASGSIEDMTFEELKKYRLLETDERIPLFSDVLSLIDGQVPLLIELKIPGFSLKICESAYQMLKQYHGDYLIQSFNTMGVRWFKLHAPEVLRGQLSSNLSQKKAKENWLFRFMVEHLLANFLGRPDFISYKLDDLPKLSVTLMQKLLNTPVAVWTLRTKEALKKGREQYDIQIFENLLRNGEH